MEYEWDATKNRANLAKHGIDFADAVAVVEDDLALSRPDSESRGEPRFVTLGIDSLSRLLVVVYTERDARLRLISARLATKQERNSYEN